MNKLDQIEANAKLQRGWADADDTAWLVARIRKLEQIEAGGKERGSSANIDWLIAKVRELRQALEPFALITEFEINERYALAGRILAADIQRAREALEED